jgi:hypothetical protein
MALVEKGTVVLYGEEALSGPCSFASSGAPSPPEGEV